MPLTKEWLTEKIVDVCYTDFQPKRFLHHLLEFGNLVEMIFLS